MNRQDDIRHILNQVQNVNEAVSGGNVKDNIGRATERMTDGMSGTVEGIGPQTVGGAPDGTDPTADTLGTSRYYIIKWADGTKEAVNRYATQSSIDLKKPIIVYDEDVSGWANQKWNGASMSVSLSETNLTEDMTSDSLTLEVCLDEDADTWVEAEVHYEASPAEPPEENYPGAEGTVGIYDIVYKGKSIIDTIDEPLYDVEIRLEQALNDEAEAREGERADWEYEQHKDRMHETNQPESIDRLLHLSGQETLKESNITNASDKALLTWLKRNDTDEPNIGNAFAMQLKAVRNEVRRRKLKYTDPALRNESLIKTFEAKR